MDHGRDAGSLYQSPRSGLCPLRRKLVWRKTRRRPLRRLAGQGFLWRIDVSFENRRVESSASESGEKAKELGFSLHRFTNDDGTYDQPGCERAAAPNVSQATAISAVSPNQARKVADRKLIRLCPRLLGFLRCENLWRFFNFPHQVFEET